MNSNRFLSGGVRHGVEISRRAFCDWLIAVADLTEPLYELLKQRVLVSKVIHTDDTQVKLIATSIGSTRTTAGTSPTTENQTSPKGETCSSPDAYERL